MKVQTAEQLRQEMEKIIDAVTAPDSLPGKIMHAKRINHRQTPSNGRPDASDPKDHNRDDDMSGHPDDLYASASACGSPRPAVFGRDAASRTSGDRPRGAGA